MTVSDSLYTPHAHCHFYAPKLRSPKIVAGSNLGKSICNMSENKDRKRLASSSVGAAIKRGATWRDVRSTFGGSSDVLSEVYTNAVEKAPLSDYMLPPECSSMHCCRMMFLHFLLGKKTEHALLQYLRPRRFDARIANEQIRHLQRRPGARALPLSPS